MMADTKKEIRGLLKRLELRCQELSRDVDELIAYEDARRTARQRKTDADLAVRNAAQTDSVGDLEELKQAATCADNVCEEAKVAVQYTRLMFAIDAAGWHNALVNLKRAELEAYQMQEHEAIEEWERFNEGHSPLLHEIDSVREALGHDALFICGQGEELKETGMLQDLKAHLADAAKELYEA